MIIIVIIIMMMMIIVIIIILSRAWSGTRGSGFRKGSSEENKVLSNNSLSLGFFVLDYIMI